MPRRPVTALPPGTDSLRRSPQQARGERRVAALLDAAAAAIAERGVVGVTAEEIARRANTAKGSFYQFFPNSEAIVSALAARYATELSTIYAAAFGDVDTRGTLRALVDRVILPLAAFHDRNPAFRHVFEAARQAREADGTGRLIHRLRETVVERIDRLMFMHFPALADEERARHARVVQAMGQALLYLRAEAQGDERAALLTATRDAVVRYLEGLTVLPPAPARGRESRRLRGR
ncbi:MAG: TetR/AcrR family transcriptional regulator [Gemmatimonadaceae bacterium]|nr:TetR/AcrR family transcriptional regulator [Gemmatimonadaceae bacterium]